MVKLASVLHQVEPRLHQWSRSNYTRLQTSGCACSSSVHCISFRVHNTVLQREFVVYKHAAHDLTVTVGVRRESEVQVSLWQEHRRKLLQLRWNRRWSLLGHVRHLHSPSACRLRRYTTPFTSLLAHPGRFWVLVIGMGKHSCAVDAKGSRKCEGQRHKRVDDV